MVPIKVQFLVLISEWIIVSRCKELLPISFTTISDHIRPRIVCTETALRMCTEVGAIKLLPMCVIIQNRVNRMSSLGGSGKSVPQKISLSPCAIVLDRRMSTLGCLILIAIIGPVCERFNYNDPHPHHPSVGG